MIAATPVIGAHYIIDIGGGAVVAAGSVLLAKHLFRSLLPKASPVSKEIYQTEPCFNMEAAAKSFR
jgi:membrane-associated phospholipid phosphatase